MAAPVRIVFVCMGNICRSPTAEVVFRAKVERAGLASRVVIASAGTGNWHVGSGIDARAGETLRAAGYDGSRHKGQQFQEGWFDDYDLVVAMDRKNRWFLEELARTPADRAKIHMLRSWDPAAKARGDLDVPDPYYGGEEGFPAVLAMVEAACDGLLADVRSRLEA